MSVASTGTQRYRLGTQTVSRIGFGAMQLPGPGVFGPPRDRDAAIAVLRRVAELGVDHIDTAQFFGPAVANELINAALYPYPDGLPVTWASPIGAWRARRHAPGPARLPGSWSRKRWRSPARPTPVQRRTRGTSSPARWR
jgi:pyridoxine 4-dehydrogenase